MLLNDCGVIFSEENHEYHLNGIRLSGLTSVMSKHLFHDKYSSVPDHILKKAAERGTRIHRDIYFYDVTDIVESEEAGWYRNLKEDEGFEVVDSEYLVTDYGHFATAIDKILLIDGDVYLGDVKTTYSLDKEYLSWQLSINKHLFEIVNPHLKVKGLKAIWVRDGAFIYDIEEKPKDEVIRLLEAEVNGEMFTPSTLVKTENKDALMLIESITGIAAEIKRLESLKDEYNRQIEKLFDSLNAEKWETDSFVITRTKSYKKETFDSKRFKEDNPDIYKSYIKETLIKSSIKTKLK